MKTFSNWDKPIACKKNNETITVKTDINLIARFIRDRHIDLQNFLSQELSAVQLVFFYPDSNMRKTSKSKVLKEIEITEYPQLLLLGYQCASATFIDFMGTIKSADFRKFEDSLM